MSNMKLKGLLAGAAVGAIFALSGGQASAATLDATITGNDCSGVWGQGFSNCVSPDLYGSSPIIAKYDLGGADNAASWSYNSLFPSIDGSEFSLTFSDPDSDGDDATVNWTYTAGTNDPDITVVAVKTGNEFDVWYDGGNAFSSGIFTTDSGKGISHVSFYDSTGGGGDVSLVPLPAGLPLILTALGVFGALRLRKRKTA